MNEQNEYKNSSFNIKLPLFMSLALAIGILMGAKFFNTGTTSNDTNVATAKFREILNLVDKEYVDTVNTDDLSDVAIEKMLEHLDPHTVYIKPKDLTMAQAQLEGEFEGIGIEFQIIKDTLYVVTPISGGPSEAVGLRSGDKIIKINDTTSTGSILNTQYVFSKLRGKKGTKVKLGIKRANVAKVLDFTVTRDKIPTFSVDVSYMIDNTTGYIKISRFAQNTYIEFRNALMKLKQNGAKRLMIDLRDNPGGYLDRAKYIVDELLSDGKKIVYTDGKESQYDYTYNADMPGMFEQGALVVLINEGSASASEIVSGAIQDNDRGIIVGRRSFGKGLVQRPIPLETGGELRVTISRYYTPSGRSIQKPYTSAEDYELDIVNRYKHGEFFNKDSIKFDQKKIYKTLKGRTVYGGGGIMPDEFVARDTTDATHYLSDLYNKGVIREYALNYSTNNKSTLENLGFTNFKTSFEVSKKMMDDFLKLAEKSGVKFDKKQFDRSEKTIKNNLKAFIARGIWKNEGFYPIFNESDEIYTRGLMMFEKAKEIEEGPVKK
ncbi:MAG: S41 family peptidase [Cytophagales bacterium]